MFDGHSPAHRIRAVGKMDKNIKNHDPFGAKASLDSKAGPVTICRLSALQQRGVADIDKLPFSVKVLLEAALRCNDEFEVTSEDVRRLAKWDPKVSDTGEVPFKVARVILQDLTGVPAVVDLAAMRAAMQSAGGNPGRINPLVPVD